MANNNFNIVINNNIICYYSLEKNDTLATNDINDINVSNILNKYLPNIFIHELF